MVQGLSLSFQSNGFARLPKKAEKMEPRDALEYLEKAFASIGQNFIFKDGDISVVKSIITRLGKIPFTEYIDWVFSTFIKPGKLSSPVKSIGYFNSFKMIDVYKEVYQKKTKTSDLSDEVADIIQGVKAEKKLELDFSGITTDDLELMDYTVYRWRKNPDGVFESPEVVDGYAMILDRLGSKGLLPFKRK
jgi:hypothetical protein